MTLLLTGLGLLAPPVVPQATAQTAAAGSPYSVIYRALSREGAVLSLRLDVDGSAAAAGVRAEASRLRAGLPGLPLQGEPDRTALLGRYRAALERESRRLLEKNPSLFQTVALDEEGYPTGDVRRDAARIFEGANNRLISQALEQALEGAAPLRHARAYAEGIRIDLMNSGSVRLGTATPDGPPRWNEEAGEAPAASFSLMMVGRPRLEMRATVPGGFRTRVEVPLASPGVRATLSRSLTPSLRGTLSGGVEDSGADRWVFAGIGLRF